MIEIIRRCKHCYQEKQVSLGDLPTDIRELTIEMYKEGLSPVIIGTLLCLRCSLDELNLK